jgi:iron complex outermembrane receptor protein
MQILWLWINSCCNNGATINRTDLVRQKWLDNDFIQLLFSEYKKWEVEMIGGGGYNKYEGNHLVR